MTRNLVLAAAALVLTMAAPAAFATRVVFDPPATTNDTLPPTTAPQCAHDDPCSIGLLNHTYQVNFIPCGDVLGVDTSGFSFCLWMNNVTTHAASKFTFQFIVPSGGSFSGDQLECGSIPTNFATDNCPQALPDPGSLFTVSFFPHPPLPNRTDFYLFTDFVNSPGAANVTLSVPEPGELGLFGLGLLMLGVGYGWRRRRLHA
ncbi:MAG: PEP-CTERM sorting domain-containing protein [Rhodanobacteraceae bacterium]